MESTEQKQIFDAWLEQHKGLLFKVVRAYAFNPADRDDLYQEIALQIWHSIAHFKGDSAVTTWIYRVALYTAMAWRKREKKHRQGAQPLASIDYTLVESAEPTDSRLDWLYEQIAQLDAIDRSLMLLSLDGFSYREMAKLLGISESNVGVKINRIKKRLGRQLQEAKDGI